MIIPRIELFEWLRNNHEHADYVLAFSKMKGVSKREYDELVDYDLGPELDLGHGDPRASIHDARAESASSSGSGNSASISSTEVACGSSVNTVRRWAHGSMPLAFAVSIRL